MSHIQQPDTTGHNSSADSYREMEYKLNTLRSVVCDLLKMNQQLRDTLLAAKLAVPHERGTL